jgi:hypothetical protein
VDSIASEHFSKRFVEKGLSIFSPVTYRGVSCKGLEKSFADLGGSMVIKVPDSNAGRVQVGNLRSSGRGLFLCCP